MESFFFLLILAHDRTRRPSPSKLPLMRFLRFTDLKLIYIENKNNNFKRKKNN